jgi:hypothetical protein
MREVKCDSGRANGVRYRKDVIRIDSRVGADVRKAGHSFSKRLADLYQCVIADPANNGVSFRTTSDASESKLRPAISRPIAVINFMTERERQDLFVFDHLNGAHLIKESRNSYAKRSV